MASSYSNNLRVGLQAAGDNPTTWGTLLNDELFTLLIAAITDLQAVSLTAGDVTLTTNNGSADQARAAMLKFTGTPGVARTVTAPAVKKAYIVWNDSDGAVTLKTSAGTGAVIAVDEKALVFCDATDFYRATLGGQTAETISGNWAFTGTPTFSSIDINGGTINGITDLAIADGGTGASTAAAARTNLLPSQTGASGKVLQSDGSDVSWVTPDAGVTDHGALTGLSDDDHTQYLLAAGTRSMSGNLTISKATPQINLTDSGGSDFSMRVASSTFVIQDVNGADDIFTLTQAGALTIDGDMTWSASDGRLKTEFQPFDSGALVDAVSVGRFRYDPALCEAAGFHAYDDKTHFGFDALSVYEHFGETAAPLAPFDRDSETGESVSGRYFRSLNDRELLAVAYMEIKALRARLAKAGL